MHILSPETDNCRKGENDRRKYFMINLHERMLPTLRDAQYENKKKTLKLDFYASIPDSAQKFLQCPVLHSDQSADFFFFSGLNPRRIKISHSILRAGVVYTLTVRDQMKRG